MHATVRRNPDLLSTPLPQARAGLVTTGLLALALVLAVVVPAVGMLWVLLLLVRTPVARLLRLT
jgi:hypothetical protein